MLCYNKTQRTSTKREPVILTTGFRHHPGDLGMKMIAERIFAVMKPYL
jgi:hypothetical protein